MTPAISPRWPSPRTWASAISTPSTSPAGGRRCTARTSSARAARRPISPPRCAPVTTSPCDRGTGMTAQSAELILAELLADIMQVEQVAAGSHFFDDLGADSLVMAHFCARIRKRADVPSVSMRDIYQYPTLRSLADSLAEVTAAPAIPAAATEAAGIAAAAEVATARTWEYVLCGALQLLFFLGYAWAAALVGARAY